MKWFRIVCGVLLLIGAVAIYYGLTFPTPQHEIQKVWLPENYEILKSSDVEPCTFKIHRSIEYFQKSSKEKRVLVVYHDGFIAGVSSHDSYPYIEYWSHGGDGTFDYLKRTISSSKTQPYSGEFWVTWLVQFNGNSFTLNPQNSIYPKFFGAVFIILVIAIWVIVETGRRQHPRT